MVAHVAAVAIRPVCPPGPTRDAVIKVQPLLAIITQRDMPARSDIAISLASIALAASIAGSATRDLFVGAPPGLEVTSIRLAPGVLGAGPARSTFGLGENVTAWLEVRGDAPAWITVRWVHAGEPVVLVEEARAAGARGPLSFVLPGGTRRPPGHYRVEVTVDDLPSVARDFEILPR